MARRPTVDSRRRFATRRLDTSGSPVLPALAAQLLKRLCGSPNGGPFRTDPSLPAAAAAAAAVTASSSSSSSSCRHRAPRKLGGGGGGGGNGGRAVLGLPTLRPQHLSVGSGKIRSRAGPPRWTRETAVGFAEGDECPCRWRRRNSASGRAESKKKDRRSGSILLEAMAKMTTMRMMMIHRLVTKLPRRSGRADAAMLVAMQGEAASCGPPTLH